MNPSYFEFENDEPILILDAGPLIAGFNISIVAERCFTTSLIFEEVRNRMARDKISSFVYTGQLGIIDVPQDFSIKANEVAKSSGDFAALSENDLSIIACAIYIRESYSKQFDIEMNKVPLQLITDDYSVQNVAALSKIKTKTYKTEGIKTYIQWIIYCPLCHKRYPSEYLGKKCPDCGGKIKRKPRKSSRNRRKR